MSGDSRTAFRKRIGKRVAERLVKKVTSPPLFELMPEIIERHPKQADFITSTDRHVAMVGGIGSGKSQGGAMRAGRASYGWIGDIRIPTPNLGVITAPTYPMLRDATIRTFIDVMGDYIDSYNKSDHHMIMKNGSEILFRSVSDPELLRGPNVSWWWGDESAMYMSSVRNIMVGRLRQFGQLGWDWQSTTPKGRNWLWQTYVRDHNALDPDGASDGWRMIRVHSRDNGFVDQAFYDELAAVYFGDFAKQELEGMFVAFEGLIYALFDRDRHVQRSGYPANFKRIICGVDWGFANPGVMIVVGFDSDDRAYVLEEVYQRRRRIEEWAAESKRLYEKWKIEMFYCDPSEPDNIRALNGQPGVRATGADNRVTPGIQAVQARLVVQGDHKPRLIVHPDCGNLMTEFEQYIWQTMRDGRTLDAPMKVNDHTMDALRYAIMGQDKPRGAGQVGVSSYVG